MVPETVSRPTVRLALRVLGETVVAEAVRPHGPIRLDEALPFFRHVDDLAIGAAVRHAEHQGETVSCRNGCAACCKAQPVPVTPPEALALLRLVEALPEPRQSEVRSRFADRVERLRGAGLEKPFLERKQETTKEEARAVAERYFGLALACPFLENDSCSIYQDRPFVCRQYLVTSPAELCNDPLHNPVRPMPMPVAAAGAMLQTAEKLLGRPQYTIPLVLALEYAQRHRAELEQRFAAQPIYEGWLQALTNNAGARE